MEVKALFKELKSDLPASIVVFFVAVPLCLGIALASGAPLFSGIIAGIVGGIVVGLASGSPLGVSGPAAGLAVIVLTSIAAVGSWPAFLLTVVLAGVFQLMLGFAKAGFIAYFFPSSVIKGMLTGIGMLILLKQIPHALGYNKDEEGDLEFFQSDGEDTFSSIVSAFDVFTPGAILISVISLAILILWDVVLIKKHKLFQIIQGPIVVVFIGILMDYFYQNGLFDFSLEEDHLVRLPVANNLTEFFSFFTFPDFSAISHPEVWKAAVVMAIVASLETLLCVEATALLKGITIGMAFGIFYTLRHNFLNAYSMKDAITTEDGHEVHHMILAENVTFFNKANIIKALEAIPANSKVIIDCANTKSLAYDVAELIKNNKLSAQLKA